MPGPVYLPEVKPPVRPFLTYDQLAERRSVKELRVALDDDHIVASLHALLPPQFRWLNPLLSLQRARDIRDLFCAVEAAHPSPSFPSPPSPLPEPWPAAWEHVGPPEAPCLKSVERTLEVLREYCDRMAVAAGWSQVTCEATPMARWFANCGAASWATLAAYDRLFHLAGAVFLTKQDFIDLPDPRAVFWGRYVEWRCHVNKSKPCQSLAQAAPSHSSDVSYERLTDRSRKVMQLANQEAQRLNHEYIGTEHILLGLAKEGNSLATAIMKRHEIDPRVIRLDIEKLVQAGLGAGVAGALPQTPRARRVIAFAIEEADALDRDAIGPEFLLLGLLREKAGVAAQVLMSCGLTLESAGKIVAANAVVTE